MDAHIALAGSLPAIGLFDGLGRTHLAWLASVSQRRTLRRSEVLFERGQPAESLYIMLTGHLKLSIPSDSGQEKILEFLDPGDVFGECVLLPDHRWIATAQALVPCRLLAFEKQELADAVQKIPGLALRLLSSVSYRMEGLLCDIESATFRSAAQRVAEYVLRQPRVGNQTRLQFHKRAIASKLGLQPETFSRSLKQLVADGLITVQGPRILIHDESALQALVA